MKILMMILISLPAFANTGKWKAHMKDMCHKILTHVEDPYKYEGFDNCTLEELVNKHNDQVAWIELRARLDDPNLPEEERAKIIEVLGKKK